MRTLLVTQALLLVLVSALLLVLSTAQNSASYASGSALVFLNFLFLSTGWTLIFNKKWVAIAIAIIVIKYAILGVLLYSLMHQPWLDLTWLVVGVSSFIGTTLIYAKRQHGV